MSGEDDEREDLQKREDGTLDGEKTGEFEIATVQDIFLCLFPVSLSNVRIFFAFYGREEREGIYRRGSQSGVFEPSVF